MSLTLFMLQIVMDGKGMSEMGTGMESKDSSTGLETYFSKTFFVYVHRQKCHILLN